MAQRTLFLPEEMILKIGWYLWYSRASPPRGRYRGGCDYPDHSSCSRFLQLASRNTSVLSVCRHWRRALLPTYCRVVVGCCQLDSALLPHPFIKSGFTREVWLHFDGYLLFGKWAIECVSVLLSHVQTGLSVDSLVIIIADSPPSALTPNERERARSLAEVCQRALLPRSVALVCQPTDDKESTEYYGFDPSSKFEPFYNYLSLAPNPPQLTAIESTTVNTQSMIMLISSNSETLERLCVQGISIPTLQKTTKGAEDNVVFSRLQKLQLVLDQDGTDIQPYDIATRHFPSLRRLDIAINPLDIEPSKDVPLSIYEHNFLVDLFFHDLTHTCLHSLTFPVSWDTVEILSPTLLRNVRHVCLTEISTEGEHLLDDEESNQLLQNILYLGHIRSVVLDNSASHTFIDFSHNWRNLHTLSILNYSLTIDQAVRIMENACFLTALDFTLIQHLADTAHDADQNQDRDQVKIQDAIDNAKQKVPPGQKIKYKSALSLSLKTMRVNIGPEVGDDTIAVLCDVAAVIPHLESLAVPHKRVVSARTNILHVCERQRYKWSSALEKTLAVSAL